MPHAAARNDGPPDDQAAQREIASAAAECTLAMKRFQTLAMRLGAAPQCERATTELVAGMGRIAELQGALDRLSEAQFINSELRIAQEPPAAEHPVLRAVRDRATA
jgi:hypothetical protein